MANKIVPQTLNSSGVYDKLITAISSGGTGAESESAAVKNLISGLTSISPTSDDLIPFQDVSSGGAGKTTLSALASALQSVRGYAKIQTGSYVGTGTYGASNPCSLTFSSIPKFIIISRTSQDAYSEDSSAIFVMGCNCSPIVPMFSNLGTVYANTIIYGTTVRWYNSNNPSYQFNDKPRIYNSNVKYFYVAFI